MMAQETLMTQAYERNVGTRASNRVSGPLNDAVSAIRGNGVSAVVCSWLPVISIFDDEHYENYDYDIVGPRERRKIASALCEHGFRQTSGRVFEKGPSRFEFPRPTRSLSGDPAAELERVLLRAESVPFSTPTQALLVTCRRAADEDSLRVFRSRLVSLVREQPANLAKIGDWLRGTTAARYFSRLREELAVAQASGFEARRAGRFRSEFDG